ncbi:uncharacterized protein SPSK_08636 [Sporothrix schenckii 1099-18]|uniref:Mucin-7 n=2 Tax=Sporothrix schenckii TaxID=29908 RepID=U7PYC5_SPOS1|nr:uncharacterized protein SPSK_08636 [Sporothrix schenckii 1099-18]ERS99744.1 hypothetical protein HMPREF1624_03108 [Sporothrix schenckii ATCC 58251]KJR85879.1 hypothetical protein SPSK_08636 [Sporothrix schenckii 1099-18]
MSQVKNLRAMFEQKGDSSPPDRGREGLPSTPTDSPRPLSRVRTSFVTVEKDGRVGLQRDTSSDSVPTLSRTLSGGTESDVAVPGVPLSPARSRSPIKLEDSKPAPTTQTPKRMPAPIPEESTPVTPTKAPLPASVAKPVRDATPKPQPSAEVKVSAPTPVQTNKDETSKSLDAKAAQRDKSPAPTPRKLFPKPADGEPASGTPKKTLDAPAPASNGVKKAASVPKGGLSSQPAPPAAARTNGASNGVAKDAPVTGSSRSAASTSSLPLHPKVTSTGPGSKEAHKPIATSAGKSAPKAIATVRDTTKPAAKSPGLAVKSPTVKTPKTPTSPAKPTTAKTTATKATTTTTSSKPTTTSKLPSKKPASTTTTATAPKLTAGSKSSSSAAGAKKPAAVQTFPPNGIGFVKPKVKSPTRPVQLPSSLTTHTASSATKAGVPRPSLSRQSGNFLTLHQPASSASAARSPSRTSTSSAAAAGGPRTLRRQSSTVSRPRPSIGPPPKQTARDHPVTRKEKEVDEGFLARMMRPTQASALKTADKAQLSPPRKQPVVAHVAAVPIATKTVRKSSAPRESVAATATGKKVVPEAPSLANRPPACITRNPDFPPPTKVAESVKEEVPNPYAAAAAKETEPVKDKEGPEEEEGLVEEDVVEEKQAEEEAAEEESIEETAEEEDAPAVAEVPVEEEEEAEDESHVESVEGAVVKEEATDEPESAPTAEAASEVEKEADEDEDEGREGEEEEEAKEAVKDSDMSAVEASVAESVIPEAEAEH